jgi:hypothetical protein
MRRWEAWLNHVALSGVILSGLVYAVMKYLLPGSDPDSRLGHPWQPQFAKAHALFAPVAVFGLGLLFRHHALARVRRTDMKGHRTGLLLVWAALPVAATGYLVPAFTGEGAARAAGLLHTALGVVLALAYGLHPRKSVSKENGGGAVENGDG